MIASHLPNRFQFSNPMWLKGISKSDVKSLAMIEILCCPQRFCHKSPVCCFPGPKLTVSTCFALALLWQQASSPNDLVSFLGYLVDKRTLSEGNPTHTVHHVVSKIFKRYFSQSPRCPFPKSSDGSTLHPCRSLHFLHQMRLQGQFSEQNFRHKASDKADSSPRKGFSSSIV